MIDFKVDHDLCTQCKTCVVECPVLIINGKTIYPEIKEGKENQCLKCQHCLAVCPEGAISIWGKDPKNSKAISDDLPIIFEMENLMMSRRSIRKFRKEELDKELILRLISAASYAPTAKNENSVLFTVIDDTKNMSTLRELAYLQIEKAYTEKRLPQSFLYLYNFQQIWKEKQIDVIFRNAPHMLITSAPRTGTFPQIDCTIATSYFDLLANSCEIGTLWNGFAKYVFEDVAPELKKELNIPEDHIISTVLIFGMAGRKYVRTIQNKPMTNVYKP